MTVTSSMAGDRIYSRTALILLAASMAISAAVIHLVAGPPHMRESAILGAILVAGGVIQAAAAVALFARPSTRIIVINLALAAIGTAAWWFVRGIGLPLGDGWWRPEAISVPDLASLIAESIALLALAGLAIRGGRRPGRKWRTVTAGSAAGAVGVVLMAIGAVASADDTWLPISASVGAPYGRTTTLMYCSPGGAPLAMDLYEPAAGAMSPAPVVLYVHGGGGTIGDRQAAGPGASLANQDGALFGLMRERLLARGFVVASIDYRLQPLFPWRDQIEDAKCAVRFLRAHAGSLSIDSGHIGVWGSSEGGYLAAMLGTAGPSAGFDVGAYTNQSSSVEAVIDMFGPSDFTRTNDSSGFVRAILQLTFHGDVEAERQASPVTYVAPGDPPFLIYQGTDDKEIPLHHSIELSNALSKASVPNTLVIVRGAGHGLNTSGQQPGPQTLAEQAVNFLADQLIARP